MTQPNAALLAARQRLYAAEQARAALLPTKPLPPTSDAVMTAAERKAWDDAEAEFAEAKAAVALAEDTPT